MSRATDADLNDARETFATKKVWQDQNNKRLNLDLHYFIQMGFETFTSSFEMMQWSVKKKVNKNFSPNIYI